MEILGFFVLVALLGMLPAAIAQSKGRSFGLWWIYGAALFIVALPHALITQRNLVELEEKQLSEGMKKCPACAELIKSEAKICRYCGTAQPETAHSQQILEDAASMEAHGIRFEKGAYTTSDGYDYDTLSEAIAHARHS
jgi:hypothetical protein